MADLTFAHLVVAALVLGLCALLYDGFRWLRSLGRSSVYTRDGSPINIDQYTDERQRMLRSARVHRLVSPHAQKPMPSNRTSIRSRSHLQALVKAGDRRT